MNDDFLYRDVPALGRRLFRLGLATNYGVEGADLEWALEQGVNYVFWTPNARRVTKSLKAAIKRDRESFILASGPTIGSACPIPMLIWCSPVLKTAGNSKIIYVIFGKKVPCQRKKTAGSETSGRLFTGVVRGLHSGFSLIKFGTQKINLRDS